uniref:At1g61320/AtMIF1 LRR domain-containing protein n=1 Tax=Oryza punctata TaxID=4537 RepID=A0A0E0L503_ORYPU
MPLRDAARTACISRAFLRSWRCHPNLTFTKKTLGLDESTCGKDEVERELTNRVDQIMRYHSGIGVKAFKLESYDFLNARYLNRWLQIVVTPRIEELTLILHDIYKEKRYNFPCSLLFNMSRNSIMYLRLVDCAFHPTVGLHCLRTLHLSMVCTTGDDLGCFLSDSFNLEQLILTYCGEINCLKTPCLLRRLCYLKVVGCKALKEIDIKAPNLSTFFYDGYLIHISLGHSLKVKNLEISCYFQSDVIQYTCDKLSSIVPNIETLSIHSFCETVNAPIVPFRFLHLKYLEISFNGHGSFSPTYDYFSLVYFLEASPILETFSLTVSQTRMKHDVISKDSSHLRQMPEHRHDKIKNVKIIGFCSAKSMIELTCYILETATSLQYLTLDTICNDYENADRLSAHRIGGCGRICRYMIREAEKALLAIETYIVGKVPSSVKLDVLKPCSWCHVGNKSLGSQVP